jgi:V/A-type H+-transporting ATPase subunit E
MRTDGYAATSKSSAELLAQTIIAQAQEEADKIRQAAKAEAARLIAAAETDAAGRHQAVRAAEASRAHQEKSRGIALARLEARRLFLQAREDMLEQVFSRTKTALATSRKAPQYLGLLARLMHEGMTALAGERFTIEVAPEDQALARQALDVPTLQGQAIEVQGRQGIDGGCIVWQQDRRALYDNTFASILRRQKERLRPLIAAWLWGDAGYWRE